jgi:hypothetical protein
MNEVIEAESVTATENPLTGAQDVATVERGQPPIVPSGASAAAQLAMAVIEASRRESGAIDKDVLAELRSMAKELRAEEREAWFNRDMADAQAECQAVVRSSEVKLIKDGKDLGSYNYASLDAIDEMLRPIRTKYGFSITHDRKPRQGDGGGLEVISTLRHRSGHSITASFPLALDSGPGRSNAQAAGSTDSYGRKYNAIGFFDVIRKNDDNDGALGGVMPIGNDKDGREKAERIRVLVQQAGIGDGLPKEERAEAIKDWFKTDAKLDYLIGNYLDVRIEDYPKVVRLLVLEAQVNEARVRKGAQI